MSDDMFDVGFWLTRAAVMSPVLVTLVVGLVICHRQWRRRPRLSRLLGYALLVELIWLTVGCCVFDVFCRWLGVSGDNDISNPNNRSWILRRLIVEMPSSWIHATIWGMAIGAVFSESDRQERTVGS